MANKVSRHPRVPSDDDWFLRCIVYYSDTYLPTYLPYPLAEGTRYLDLPSNILVAN